MNNEDYMRIALEEAEKSIATNDVPIGAIIVCDNKIIGRGHNTRERDCLTIGHAEINAINEACKYLKSWKLDECTIYTTCEPCVMCMGTIIQSRIKKVVYGCKDEKAGMAGSVFDMLNIQKLNHYPIVIGNILTEECSKLIVDNIKNIRNRKKEI